MIDAASAGPSSFVDLHTHSTASDGVLPPDRVVAAAHAAGISALALTDHDTVAGIPLATVTGKALGVRVVCGVELSAHDGDREIHILALHVTRHGLLESRLEFLPGRTAAALLRSDRRAAEGTRRRRYSSDGDGRGRRRSRRPSAYCPGNDPRRISPGLPRRVRPLPRLR